MNNKQEAIEGAGGGKGGGGRVAQEAPNTLSSRAIVRVVEVLSEGEIVGIAGGGRGIYINDTALENADASSNFKNTQWDYRVGQPDQPYMQGFPAVEAEFTINTSLPKLITGTPYSYTRTSSASNIDNVRLTIGLTNGFYSQDTTNGDLNGTEVSFTVETKLTASGSWVLYDTFTIKGKSTSPTEKQYRINRPTGTGTWDIRVTRTTTDSTSAALQNAIQVSRITEVQDLKLQYNDTAYVGIAIDAETVGNQIPRRSYMVKGRIVKIPNNYNPTTRVYTGIWSGTFTNAWTDNPAWILYDMLTHPRYGLGEFIPESIVDKWAFYDAAVYNDVLVNTITPSGTIQEPRFTFNAVLPARSEAFRLLTLIAGSMRTQLIQKNGLITLIQDRPSDPVKLITKANVIDGVFEYRSTGLQERHTAFNITFNDRNDRHLQRTTTIDASTQPTGDLKTLLTTAENRYGYNPVDVIAFGATTEGQAIRHGRWLAETELNQTEIVQFQMSLNGFDLMPGDIVKVFDEDYAASAGGGRIISVSGTTVVLDRPVSLTAGSKIEVLLADGVTIEQRNITQTTGSLSTITIASAFSQSVLEGADFIVTTTIQPRQFKIIGLKQDDLNIITVEALFHDPNKYARVEANVSLPAPVFSDTRVGIPGVPRSLTFKENVVQSGNEVVRKLLVSWQAPLVGTPLNYVLQWRKDNSEWNKVTGISGFSHEISPATAGTYEVAVNARSITGVDGPTVTGTYTIDISGVGTSALAAVTGLQIVGGGTTFPGLDINTEWTYPASNANVLTTTLRDFEVRVLDNTTLKGTYYVPAVAPGDKQTFSLTYAMNQALSGGPFRTLTFQVRCRDVGNKLSTNTNAVFTNNAPPALTGITVDAGIGNVKIAYNQPTDTDAKGVLVWRSSTSGFTPSSANLMYDTSDNYIVDAGVDYGVTVYYRLAPYDAFSKPLNGAGLNLSSEYSILTQEPPGIPEVSVLPNPNGYTGPGIVLLTSDGQLYSYVNGAWQPTIEPVTDVLDGSITIAKHAAGLRPIEIVSSLPTTNNVEGRLVYLTADDKVYRYTGTAWTSAVPAVDITGQLTDAQISALAAAKLTGQIVASQVADAAITTAKFASGIRPIEIVATLPTTGNIAGRLVYLTTDSKVYRFNGTAWTSAVPAVDITGQLTDAQLQGIAAAKLTGQITSTQITDNSISTPKLQAGSVSTAQLAAGAITAEKIAAGTITAAQIAAGTITGTQIAAGTITATQLAADSITAGQIAAGAISTSELAAGAITADKIAAGVITADKIAANSITAGQIATGAITADKILANAVTAVKIDTGAITADKIATNAITAGKIAANAVTAGTIAAAAITASEIAAGAITAEKLRIASNGAALNLDPACSDSTAWTLYSGSAGTFTTITDGVVGNTVLRSATGVMSWYNGAQRIPFDPLKTYRIRARARRSSDANGTLYIGTALFDANGTNIAGAGTQWFYAAQNQAIGTGWDTYSGRFGAGTANPFPANGKTIAPLMILNYNGTAGFMQVQDVRIEEVIPGELIVDGTITATKIAAGTITANELAANSIIAGKIAANAVTSTTIATGAVTADKIVANSITGDKIVAGTIDASKIDTRNLTIKNSAGDIIFSSGVPLTATWADASLRNSSITISGGALQGIGTGAGTAVANSNITIVGGALQGIGTGAGTAVANSNISIGTNGVLSGAGGGQVTIPGLGISHYRVYAAGLDAVNAGRAVGLFNQDTSGLVAGAANMYCVARFSRTTGAFIGSSGYNTHAGAASTMAAHLNSLGSNEVVVIFSYDEPQLNRDTGGLPAAIYRCGGSPGIFGSTAFFRYRSAYILIGIPGIGTGNGYELYKGDTDSNASSWCEAGFHIQGGQVHVSALASQPKFDAGNITTYIAGAAIGTALIQNAAITNALIGDAAITSAKIADAAITTAKIGSLAVGTLNIQGDAVTVPLSASGTAASISVTVVVPAGQTYKVVGQGFQSSQSNPGGPNTLSLMGVTTSLIISPVNSYDNVGGYWFQTGTILPAGAIGGQATYSAGTHTITLTGNDGVQKQLTVLVAKR